MARPSSRADHGLRPVLPFAVTLLLVLIEAVPTHLPRFGEISPALPVVALFYWSIFTRDTMGPVAAFTLGAFNDVVLGTPLGLSSLVYLLVQNLCASQRRFFLGKPFHVVWGGFALIAIGAQIMGWLLASILEGQVLPALSSFFSALMTIAIYPLLSWSFAQIQLTLLDGR